jgi:hypothetical protein
VVMAQFPNNQALKKIMQQRQLKILDLTPSELKEVEDSEIASQKQEQQQPDLKDQNAKEAQQITSSINDSLQSLAQ